MTIAAITADGQRHRFNDPAAFALWLDQTCPRGVVRVLNSDPDPSPVGPYRGGRKA